MGKTRAVQGFVPEGKAPASKSTATAAQHVLPAEKPRTIVNVAGLFGKHLTKNGDVRNLSDPRRHKYAGVAKAKHRSSTAAKQHPLFLNFRKAASSYQEGATQSVSEQLDAVHEELLARINGIDIDGKPLAILGAPSQADVDKLEREHKAISRPLSEDLITVEHRHRNGTVTEEHVNIGKAMADFRRMTEVVGAKVVPMLRELDELDDEIGAVLKEIRDEQATTKADKALQMALAALKEEAGQAAKLTLGEVKAARKEDKAAGDVANKKFQEFFRSL